jgi:hypothetical protein
VPLVRRGDAEVDQPARDDREGQHARQQEHDGIGFVGRDSE